MTLLDKDFVPKLSSMEQYHAAIALEAGVVADAVDTLTRYLPGLVAGFKEKVSAFTNGTVAPSVPLSKNHKLAFEVLRSVDYLTLSHFAVHTHEGFNGRLMEFVPVMDKLMQDMNSVQSLLKDYRVFLSSIISDRNARKSLAEHFRKYKAKAAERKAINEMVNAFYKPGSVIGKKKFAEVYARNSDAESYIIQMGRIKHSLDAFRLKDLQDEVAQCVTLLEIVLQRVQSGDMKEVSGEVSTDLADMAYLIGTEVEEVALNYHRIQIFIATANQTSDMLSKINPNE